MEYFNFGPNSRKQACPSITNVIYSIFYYRKHLYMYTYVNYDNFATKFQFFIVPFESQKRFEN